jgi:hypothetical protein
MPCLCWLEGVYRYKKGVKIKDKINTICNLHPQSLFSFAIMILIAIVNLYDDLTRDTVNSIAR